MCALCLPHCCARDKYLECPWNAGLPITPSCIQPVRSLLFTMIKMYLCKVLYRKYREGTMWFALMARRISSAQAYLINLLAPGDLLKTATEYQRRWALQATYKRRKTGHLLQQRHWDACNSLVHLVCICLENCWLYDWLGNWMVRFSSDELAIFSDA